LALTTTILAHGAVESIARGAARLVVAIHYTQSIDRIPIKIGAESEASYDGPEEKMLQRCDTLPT
jgi:hypothetical protein